MKTKLLKFAVGVLMLGFFWGCNLVVAADAANLTSADLGVDFYQGRTNRIASVYDVTLTHVRVRYENGNLSRPIPRTELSGELARRYPYDAEKAAAFLAQKAAQDAQRIATQQAAYQAHQQSIQNSRFTALQAEIDRLNARNEALQKEVNILHLMPRGNGRKVRLHGLLNEQQGIRERVLRLQAQQSVLR